MVEQIHIVMISDANFIIPTAVCIQSIIQSKNKDTHITFHVIAENILENQVNFLNCFNKDENIAIDIISVGESSIAAYHHDTPNTFRAASMAALYKFSIPDLLPNLEKVLYMDGDIIVRSDLSELYNCDMKDQYAAVVMDSGVLYSQSRNVQRFPKYFNSGVMLLNLAALRRDNCAEKLIKIKMEEQESTLVDQNVLNTVFEGHVVYMPLTYNFLYTNLLRAARTYTEETIISQIRSAYHVDYASISEIFDDAAVLHFSSRDKPWKDKANIYHDEWFAVYEKLVEKGMFEIKGQSDSTERKYDLTIAAVIFNREPEIVEWLDELLTMKDIEKCEILLIFDGTINSTLHMLMEHSIDHPNIRIICQPHKGKAASDNQALRIAKGDRVYFPGFCAEIDISILEQMLNSQSEQKPDFCFLATEQLPDDAEQGQENLSPEGEDEKFTSNIRIFTQESLLPYLRDWTYSILPPVCCCYSKSLLEHTRGEFAHDDGILFIKALLNSETIGLICSDKISEYRKDIMQSAAAGQTDDFYQYYDVLLRLTEEITSGQVPDEKHPFMAEILKYVSQLTAIRFSNVISARRYLPDYEDDIIKHTLAVGFYPLLEYQDSVKSNAVRNSHCDDSEITEAMRKQIEEIYQSKSYKIGNFFMDPIKKLSVFTKKLFGQQTE